MKNNFKYCALALAVAAVLTGCNDDNNNKPDDNNGNTYDVPIASNVTISGDSYVDSTLTGQYKFIDPNVSPRPEGDSAYEWKIDNEDDDRSNDVSIGTDRDLLLTAERLDQQVYFCVTPEASGTSNSADKTNTTTGETKCSTATKVESGDGNKPVADNATIDKTTPTVGDTLTGRYDYSDTENDPEGTSTFRWTANDTNIAGADKKQLTLTNQQENKAIKFCVIPVSTNPNTIANSPLVGDEVCTAATAAALALAGDAPTATKPVITGDHTVGSTLTAEYTYADNDGDQEASSVFTWQRDGSDITDATGKTYTLQAEDKGKSITFVVTPVAATGTPTTGSPVTSDTITDVSSPVGDTPVIALEAIAKSDSNYPKVGDTLTGSYSYTASGSGAADDSTAVWKANSVIIAGVDCSTDQACDLPLTADYQGQSLQYCVTPKATDSNAGAEQCSTAETVFGVKVTGTLELGKTLNVETFGYQNPTFEWKVTTDNKTGPQADNNRETKGTAASYLIGDEIYKQIINADASLDLDAKANGGNGNKIVDDSDWQQAIANGHITADTTNAAHYVGKDVELVITTTEEGALPSLLASQQDTVTGGVHYDATNASLRGIEPTREVTFTRYDSTAVYHRPLTSAETLLKDQVGFGAGLLKANYDQDVMGMNWATFKLILNDTQPGVTACLSLYDDQKWNLPASRIDGSYVPNGFSAFGNESVGNTDNKNVLILKLTNIGKPGTAGYGLIGNQQPEQYSSPVFGWPTNSSGLKPDGKPQLTSYWSSTTPDATTPIAKTNAVKFYANGSSGNNSVGNGNFVSCVKGQ